MYSLFLLSPDRGKTQISETNQMWWEVTVFSKTMRSSDATRRLALSFIALFCLGRELWNGICFYEIALYTIKTELIGYKMSTVSADNNYIRVKPLRLLIYCVIDLCGCITLVARLGQLPHYDVMSWKSFPHYWSFMNWIHRSSVDSFTKGR